MNPRVHLPLQSFSDPILRRMNRKYTVAQFREKVRLIHRYLPDWAITTDIIVGFPGETEADFERDARLRRDRRLRQRIHVHLLDPARHAGRALGASARARPLRRDSLVCATHRTRRPAPITIARSVPTVRALVCGPSKKDAQQARRQDARQRHGRSRRCPTTTTKRFTRANPGSTSKSKRRTCGAAPARSSRRAERFGETGSAVVRPAISLISTALGT